MAKIDDQGTQQQLLSVLHSKISLTVCIQIMFVVQILVRLPVPFTGVSFFYFFTSIAYHASRHFYVGATKIEQKPNLPP